VKLSYSEPDENFRRELRAWLQESVPAHGAPPPPHDWPARRAYDTSWQRKLFDAGYAGMDWPPDYGGRGAPLSEQLVYHEEMARARAPYIGVNFVGVLHGGPTLIVEGTPDQKKRHLPRILKGEEVWCQGFSEPSAGSDLASLRTRAEIQGDHYVINGHKIWTSFAQVADYCELLVRTDPAAPKHRGITWLILPMNSPGITIQPLRTLLGESEFSEMFLEDVRVPIENRVGNENDGWRVCNVTFRFERGTAFAGEMYKMQEMLLDLVRLSKRLMHHGESAWDDKSSQREIAHLQGELDALWAMLKLSISEASSSGTPGPGASAIKLYYTDLYQRFGDLAMRLLGRTGLSRVDVGGLPAEEYVNKAMHALSLTIAAGTSQIQRNIIAERILGLPKER